MADVADHVSKTASRRKLEDAQTAEEVRHALLEHLRADRKWYAKHSEWNKKAWNGLTFLAIVLATLASILTAVNDSDKPVPGIMRVILIVLPALSALCGALLVQFRFKDACRIRDHGRIATEKLICETYLLTAESREKALTAAVAIRMAAHELEEEQLAQITGGDRPQRVPG